MVSDAQKVCRICGCGGPDDHPLVCACGRGCGTLTMFCEDCVGTVNWAALSPAQAFAALKAAPKVAGPWTPDYYRYSVTGESVAWRGCDCRSWFVRRDPGPATYSREACDARLTELGWILVDEESPS